MRPLLLALLLFGPALHAYDAPVGVTLAVKLGTVQLNSYDLLLTQKKGYVHVLFNAAPYLTDLTDAKAMQAAAHDIIANEAIVKFPTEKNFKIDVADVSASDDYGQPAWDKIKLIERFTATAKKSKVSVKKVKAAR